MKSWAQVQVPRVDPRYVLPEISLMNSKTGTTQLIKSKDIYRMYVCGITPYDATHLGHAATYLTFDLINRYLRARGADVKYVQNITDIDDPLLERAKRDGIDWVDLAHSQIELFTGDMVSLRVIAPNDYIGAVEAIPLVVKSILDLQEKGAIYKVGSDYYFSNSPQSDFGGLSHLSRRVMERIFAERGGDPTLLGKLDSLDCLVWMEQRKGEPGWPSPLGIGRPGWHIECTAIALEYLHPESQEASLIDIQGGGSDLIFPHHEMCRSQAKILTGKELAATYVHAGMIGLDGEKMSKSKGNLVLVSKLITRGVDPMAIRYALMMHHYREDQMWSEEILLMAEQALSRIRTVLASHEIAQTRSVTENIIRALANDLDTPSALKAIDEWVQESFDGGTGGDADEFKQSIDALLGIEL